MKRPDTFRQLDPVKDADALPVVSCAEALRARDKPVVLFTPALLFTHGGFDRDPMAEFDAYCPAPSATLRPFCVDLTKDKWRFFHGMGIQPPPGRTQPVNWDKRLYAIDKEREEECFGFLNGIAYSNPKTNLFASTFSYDLSIPDPTALLTETLLVRVFGVIGNTFIVWVNYNAAKPDKLPTVQTIQTHDPQRVLRSLSGAPLLTEFTGNDPLDMRD
jgi:hypothetical protein